jgi:large subunit ribosomal protein L10
MTGPLIYGFSEDAVAAAKVVADFAKTNDKLVIRGGVSEARPWTSTALSNWQTSQKEVLLAQCAACSCRLSRAPPLCWALWRPRKAKASRPPPEPECSANQPIRKSKWHSIKTHS